MDLTVFVDGSDPNDRPVPERTVDDDGARLHARRIGGVAQQRPVLVVVVLSVEVGAAIRSPTSVRVSFHVYRVAHDSMVAPQDTADEVVDDVVVRCLPRVS